MNERIGYETEIDVQSLAYKLGIDISIPFTPLRYDHVWDIDGILYRVQIKHSQPIIKDDIPYGFEFSGKSDGTNRYDGQVDGFATVYEGKLYFVPISEIKNENKLYYLINYGHSMNEFKWAIDYEVNSIKKLKQILKRNNI